MKTIQIVLFIFFSQHLLAQSENFGISLNYFYNDIALGNKQIKALFPAFLDEVIIMDHQVHNYSMNASLDKHLFKGISAFLQAGYKRLNFNTQLSSLGGNTIRGGGYELYDFYTLGLGLKYRFSIEEFDFYLSTTYQKNYSKTLPGNVNAESVINPTLSFQDRLNGVSFSIAYLYKIRDSINLKFEILGYQSFDRLIKEFAGTDFKYASIGLGAEYLFGHKSKDLN